MLPRAAMHLEYLAMITDGHHSDVMSYLAAMVQFFGLKPGQRPVDMGNEIKAAGDREFYIAGLIANGYTIKNDNS